MQKYLVETITFVFSLLLGVLFGVITFFTAPDGSDTYSFASFAVGLIVTLLLETVFLSLKCSIDSSNDSRELRVQAKELRDLAKMLKESHKHGSQLTVDFQRHIENLNRAVKVSGEAAYRDYLSEFSVTSGGFEVKSEEWAIRAYQRLWEFLVRRQLDMSTSKPSKNGVDDCIIARITHSNDINIWRSGSEMGRHAESLLLLQEEFIKAGGKIVRLLLMRDASDESGKRYEDVREAMTKKGIEAIVLPIDEKDNLPYDFLWATDKEESIQCVCKWFSSAGGWRLASCEITENVDDKVRQSWRTWANRCPPFHSIPSDRNTY